jgi:hypothetical protein
LAIIVGDTLITSHINHKKKKKTKKKKKKQTNKQKESYLKHVMLAGVR